MNRHVLAWVGVTAVMLAGALLAVAFGLAAAPRFGRSGGVPLVFLLVRGRGRKLKWSIVPDQAGEAFNKRGC